MVSLCAVELDLAEKFNFFHSTIFSYFSEEKSFGKILVLLCERMSYSLFWKHFVVKKAISSMYRSEM